MPINGTTGKENLVLVEEFTLDDMDDSTTLLNIKHTMGGKLGIGNDGGAVGAQYELNFGNDESKSEVGVALNLDALLSGNGYQEIRGKKIRSENILVFGAEATTGPKLKYNFTNKYGLSLTGLYGARFKETFNGVVGAELKFEVVLDQHISKKVHTITSAGLSIVQPIGKKYPFVYFSCDIGALIKD